MNEQQPKSVFGQPFVDTDGEWIILNRMYKPRNPNEIFYFLIRPGTSGKAGENKIISESYMNQIKEQIHAGKTT